MEKENICVLGFIIGILFMSIFTFAFGFFSGIHLSKQTANDVCKIITNNENAIAKEDTQHPWKRQLICEIPSYDSTQNIVIKYNNEEK